MKWWILPASLVAVLISIWLLLYAEVPLSTLLSLGLGAASLAWLVLLLIVPWNLYFGARALLQEIKESREHGITISEERDEEARRIARRTLVAAVGGHVVSAAVIVGITVFSGAVVGYYFAGFYLLSTAFRPMAAYFRHLRRRVGVLMHEARYPREDVNILTGRVDALVERNKELVEYLQRVEGDLVERIEQSERGMVARIGQSEGDLRVALSAVEERARGSAKRVGLMEQRLDGIALRFEDTVDRITDNHEVITGLKAFLRLLKSQD
ncbi:hypothetical protein [Nonomuraea sp. NPDC046570]|uniref:hypothetical protein n=1 Tax=Nonomuraea sp. NPDC046570 TaxID=3155255 RepID=UPI0033EA1684